MPSFVERLGALVLAPRRLARRDLGTRDGKASDDFLVFALVAILLEGAAALHRAADALAAGRTNGALHALVEVARPALPLLLLWVAGAALFSLFTIRAARRSPGELGARVAEVFVVASLLVSPVANAFNPGRVRYTLAALPWAMSAVWFGLALRESLEAPPEALPRLPASSKPAGRALLLAMIIGAGLHLREAYEAATAAPPVSTAARPGKAAPPIDLPLLDGGRFQLAAVKGRPVLLTFWATWCPPCMEELPALQRAYAARATNDPGAPLLYAINVDESGPTRTAAVQRVVQRFGLTFPIVLDDGPTSDAYAVMTIPTAVRIDAQGNIRAVFNRPLDEADLKDALAR